jgi:hypothetical protein
LKRPKDIRLETEVNKVRVYDELEAVRSSGIKVNVEEYDGFPCALILLNGEPAHLTDILSIEKSWSGRVTEQYQR